MNKDDVITLLRKAVAKAGSQRSWAREHGLSDAYVSDVLSGRRDPGQSILDALGLESEMIYRKS